MTSPKRSPANEASTTSSGVMTMLAGNEAGSNPSLWTVD